MVEVLKEMIADAIETGMLSDICVGVLTAESPLKVKLENGLELEERFLLVAERLTKREERGKIKTWSEQEGDIWSEYRMIRDVGLKTGQQVMVLQCKGGQQYMVIDRWKGGKA